MIHRLAARALVREWDNGMLDEDPIESDVKKVELKQTIIDLGIQFSLVTPFTSFIAVEERHEGEVIDKEKIPKIEDLIGNEKVDDLSYIEWEKVFVEEEIFVGELKKYETVYSKEKIKDYRESFRFYDSNNSEQLDLNQLKSLIDSLGTVIPLNKLNFLISEYLVDSPSLFTFSHFVELTTKKDEPFDEEQPKRSRTNENIKGKSKNSFFLIYFLFI